PVVVVVSGPEVLLESTPVLDVDASLVAVVAVDGSPLPSEIDDDDVLATVAESPIEPAPVVVVVAESLTGPPAVVVAPSLSLAAEAEPLPLAPVSSPQPAGAATRAA